MLRCRSREDIEFGRKPGKTDALSQAERKVPIGRDDEERLTADIIEFARQYRPLRLSEEGGR